MRILIIALSSGEADLPLHHASVLQQQGADFQYIEIANKSNLSAHTELYTLIMRSAAYFDAFIKLDGDMVFRDRLSAARMASLICGDVDLVTYPVLDFVTNRPIPGIHVFSPNCTWRLDEIREPYVDPRPDFPGSAISLTHTAECPVFHGYFMDRKQAASFGAHRALKAFGPRNGGSVPFSKLGRPHSIQIRILYDAWAAYTRSMDPVRGAFIFAAERARRYVELGRAFDYKSLSSLDLSEADLQAIDHREIVGYCARYWSTWGMFWNTTYRALAADGMRALSRRFLG